ncbi:transcriptional regulator [Mycetocola tolaasinivorans]|uniref:Transcriptional regulator n=1 Tax=Mycetocola tolaasinivorans TaxID=76635 RepID=A0A3L7A6V0_9MICO|nr:sugar-binding domain-containing protein [Mycetocola tolaasinivorans]RLP75570.1 transcriptional regulator [Mycetocola tolaasinivorans]
MTASPDSGILAATVARRFYVDGDSKLQIAEDLSISRFRVARLLDYAVANNIVRFTITAPLSHNLELAELIRKRFGYRQVIVIDAPEDENNPTALRQRVGTAAAQLLSETVTDRDVLGIGWGRTMSAMARELVDLAACTVVQLGGMVGSVSENSLELVRRVSEVGGGRAYPLFVPLIVPDEATAAGLRSQPGVQSATQRFSEITVAAAAVGSWQPADSQMRDALAPADRDRLTQMGVVTEVLASPLTREGILVPDLEKRAIALDYAGLVRIPHLILVAAGAHKADAVHAAKLGGLGDTLVTDRSLARALLKLG